MRGLHVHRLPRNRRRALLALAVSFAAAAVVGILSATASGQGCTNTFIGASGGDWSVAANWQNGVPTSSDVVCWNLGTTVFVSMPGTDTAGAIAATGDLQITGNVLTLTATTASTVANLTLAGGGELDGPTGQTLTVTASFLWGTSGAGAAGLNAATGAGMAISQAGGGTFTIGAAGVTPTFGGGSITTASPVSIANSTFASSNSPTLTTTSTITLGAGVGDLGGSGTTFSAAGVVNGTGTTGSYGFGANALTLTGGTTTVASGTSLDSGVLSITGGTLQDDGTANPTSTTLTGGTLDGTGTVKGSVTNTSGTVSPGDPPATGTLAITGAYSQGAAPATLAIVVNNTTPGTGFSRLTVGGAATLGGSLALSGSYTPIPGNTLNVLTYGSLAAGTFAITGSNASAYTAQYATTGVTLVVTPLSCPASNFDVFMAASGTWSTGSNWSQNAPPSGIQVACWATGTTVIVSGAASVDSIQAGGDLSITGGILTLTSTSNQSSVVNLSLEGGGELDGPSGRTLTVSGNFDWGGSGSGTAALNAASGSGLAISQTGGGTFAIGAATSAAFDGGSITTASPVTIANLSITTTNAPTLITTSTITLGAAVVVGGSGATFTAAGVNATGASPQTYGFGTNGLTLTGGTTTVASGSVFDTGALSIAGGTLQDDGSLSTATIDVLAGTLDLNANGTTGALSLTGGGEVNSSTGATLTVTGAIAWSGGSVNSPTGNLAINQTGTGSFSVSGSVSLDGGSITTQSPVSISGGTHFGTASPATLTTASAITLGSAVNVGGSGATFTANGVNATGSSQTYGFGANSLVLTGGMTAVSSGNVLHTGPLSLAGGTLVDDGTVTSTAVSLGGGTLEGTGAVNGPVDNVSGTVSPGDPPGPGALTVTGAYAQGAAGTLAIELDGTTAGTGFSQLQVGGATSLAGTLSLTDGSGFLPALGNTFQIISSPSSTPTGVLTLSGPGAAPFFAQYNAHDVTLTVKPTPANIAAPAITGTPSVGQSLSCSPGSWSANPSAWAYQWSRDGSPIAGATSPTYVVVSADQGHSLTCAVTASNSIAAGQPAISPAVAVPAPPAAPSAPQNSGAPVIAGTPMPGNQLSCSQGAWSGAPTSFKYQWERNATSVAGATGSTYTVQIADEASSLACAVTASNTAGAGATATSAVIVVARAGTLSCPKPAGRLGGTSLGRLALGQTRAKARHAVTRYATTGKNLDNFCLYGGWGIDAGYGSTKLLRALPAKQRARLLGRIVLVLTGNPYYALNGARPGMALTAAPKALHVGKAVHIGANDWYLTTGGGVLKVRLGIIQEVGLANQVLTRGLPAQRRLLASFNGA